MRDSTAVAVLHFRRVRAPVVSFFAEFFFFPFVTSGANNQNGMFWVWFENIRMMNLVFEGLRFKDCMLLVWSGSDDLDMGCCFDRFGYMCGIFDLWQSMV